MSQDLIRARANLRAQWLTASKRAMALRRKATEAEKETAALMKALDALEAAAPGLTETQNTALPQRRLGATVQRMIEALKARGPLTVRQLAEAAEVNLWSVNKQLQKGPFKVAGTVRNGPRASQTWTVAEAADTPTSPEAVPGS